MSTLKSQRVQHLKNASIEDSAGRIAKDGENRGMIGWTLKPSWALIHLTRKARRHQYLRSKDMINAKSEITAKTVHAVVPPGIGFFWLIKTAEAVDQPDTQESLKGRSLRRAAEKLVFEGYGVIDIPISWRNIEIPKNYEMRVALAFPL